MRARGPARAHAQRRREVGREQRPAAPVAGRREVGAVQPPRVEAGAHRGRHALERQPPDAPRALFGVEPERRPELSARGLGGVDVQVHFAAQEPIGVEVAQHEQGIGDRRLLSAPPVACRPGIGARRLRPTRSMLRASTQAIDPPPAPIDSVSTIGSDVSRPASSERVRRGTADR